MDLGSSCGKILRMKLIHDIGRFIVRTIECNWTAYKLYSVWKKKWKWYLSFFSAFFSSQILFRAFQRVFLLKRYYYLSGKIYRDMYRLIENDEILFFVEFISHEVYNSLFLSYIYSYVMMINSREAIIVVATTRVYAFRINSFNVWLSISADFIERFMTVKLSAFYDPLGYPLIFAILSLFFLRLLFYLLLQDVIYFLTIQ